MDIEDPKELVRRGYDALSLDLPGFGATPEPEAGWTTADYAAWLAEILAGLDRPVLLGHSFGGRIAVQLAALRPELVSGLVLTGVPLLRRQGTGRLAWQYRLVRTLHQRGLVGDRRMDAMREKYGSADYRAAQGVMREVLVKAVNESYDAQLAALGAAGVPVRMRSRELSIQRCAPAFPWARYSTPRATSRGRPFTSLR
jgi:pimeloyl-ACP methyl ester carboxylesterase